MNVIYVKQDLTLAQRIKLKWNNFCDSTFPQKGDSLSSIIEKIVMIICSILFLASCFYLCYKFVIEPQLTENSYSEYRDNYDATVSSSDNGVWKAVSETDTKKNEDGTIVDFDKLISLNKDVVGWITVPNTVINYPVLQNKNNPKYYLDHDINKNKAGAGAIFVDSKCTISQDGNSKSLILYGHHRRDGTMFAKILKYSDINFYKENPVIRFDTKYEKSKWVVFAIIKANTLKSQGTPFIYPISSWSSDAEFLDYIEEVEKRSLINTPIEVIASDEIIMLSTCSYEYEGFRTVVFARKLRTGETTIDVSSAKKASKPLMPDIWYR